MKQTLLLLLATALFMGCSSSKRTISKNTIHQLHSAFYQNQFTGLLIIDAKKQDTLVNFNATKYFTPASNTKIFTLYASLQTIPDSIPALKYISQNDTLYIEGTGDPTFLHPHFKTATTLAFLKKHKHITLYTANFNDKKYGAGWAWDDYPYYYQAEKSALPLYGNVVSIHNTNRLKVSPSYFKGAVMAIKANKNREAKRNLFYYLPSRKDTLEVPFITGDTLTKNLLELALQREIHSVKTLPKLPKKIHYSVPADSVYKRMMHQSDNFLAEQLLLVGSATLSDTLSSATTRRYILKNKLTDLKHPPKWVDGSGLSRYNLFTPTAMVHVLHKLYSSISTKRLFTIFPAGGVSGTIKNHYLGSEKPYIYAKSGSLSNNYCLSGYLLTKSGKTLIFSFMNNHFMRSSKEVKTHMNQILKEIRDNY